MKSWNQEISEEFDRYASVNYMDNYSIGVIYNQFGESNEDLSPLNRGFGFVYKRGYRKSKREIEREERVILFAKTLKETGNFKESISEAGIGYRTALWYTNYLNEECINRGLPLIFIKPKRKRTISKLNEKQASHIKYLAFKYSSNEVAKMYGISQSTVHAIKQGILWRDVKPAYEITGATKIINQYQKARSEIAFKQYSKIEFYDHEMLLYRLEKNLWGGEGYHCCPYCKSGGRYNKIKYKQWWCPKCDKWYCVTTDTIYEHTNTKLGVWLYVETAIAKEGHNINMSDLARQVGLSRKRIFYICQKIKRYPFKSLLLTDWEFPLNNVEKAILCL